MKGGATEFLLKPFDEDDLVRAIDAAIAFDCRESRRRQPSRFRVMVPTREILPYASGVAHALRHGFPIARDRGKCTSSWKGASCSVFAKMESELNFGSLEYTLRSTG